VRFLASVCKLSGGDHVPYCTLRDAAEPARRRISKLASQTRAHRFNE
jgi:hypothetical protein